MSTNLDDVFENDACHSVESSPAKVDSHGDDVPVVVDAKLDRNVLRFLVALSEARPRMKLGLDFTRCSLVNGDASALSKCSDEQYAEVLASDLHSLLRYNPDYGVLAGRVMNAWITSVVQPTFSQAMELLCLVRDPDTNEYAPLLNDRFIKLVRSYGSELDDTVSRCIHNTNSRDFLCWRRAMNTYLLHTPDGKAQEHLEYCYMRAALDAHGSCLWKVKRLYRKLSTMQISLSTPELASSGLRRNGKISCFLLDGRADGMEELMQVAEQCAFFSGSGGGLGINNSSIRAKGSYVKSTGNEASGLVSYMRILQALMDFFRQTRRKGALSYYLEPWHEEVYEFMDVKLRQPPESARVPGIFTALFLPDVFMQRARDRPKDDNAWSLLSSKTAAPLECMWGDEYTKFYEHLEKTAPSRLTTNPRALLETAVSRHLETSAPYLQNKDTINRCNNLAVDGICGNGTIKAGNLCTEVHIPHDKNETGTCVLSALDIVSLVNKETGDFDYELMEENIIILVDFLNAVIDTTDYPDETTRKSSLTHRPIGIGPLGLADAFQMLEIAYDSPRAVLLNRKFFEHVYFFALRASNELAKIYGRHESFPLTHLARGKFVFDLYGDESKFLKNEFDALRKDIVKYGVRNGLCTCAQPTAASKELMTGRCDSFEPYVTNYYVRGNLLGEFTLFNHNLFNYLSERGFWNDKFSDMLLHCKGRLSSFPEGWDGLDERVLEIFKNADECSQDVLINMCADRSRFTCQGQSFNLHFKKDVTVSAITDLVIKAWEKGVKGFYYIIQERKEQIDSSMSQKYKNEACALANPNNCEACQ
jgi:ribonucleoside-diphosphate reductase alpha subunit